MKTLLALLVAVAFLIATRPALAQPPAPGGDCPTCVRVRVALALAHAQAIPVAAATAPEPKSEPVTPAPAPSPEPARIYRMGSLPQGFAQPLAPVYYGVPQAYCPTGVCTIPGR